MKYSFKLFQRSIIPGVASFLVLLISACSGSDENNSGTQKCAGNPIPLEMDSLQEVNVLKEGKYRLVKSKQYVQNSNGSSAMFSESVINWDGRDNSKKASSSVDIKCKSFEKTDTVKVRMNHPVTLLVYQNKIKLASTRYMESNISSSSSVYTSSTRVASLDKNKAGLPNVLENVMGSDYRIYKIDKKKIQINSYIRGLDGTEGYMISIYEKQKLPDIWKNYGSPSFLAGGRKAENREKGNLGSSDEIGPSKSQKNEEKVESSLAGEVLGLPKDSRILNAKNLNSKTSISAGKKNQNNSCRIEWHDDSEKRLTKNWLTIASVEESANDEIVIEIKENEVKSLICEYQGDRGIMTIHQLKVLLESVNLELKIPERQAVKGKLEFDQTTRGNMSKEDLLALNDFELAVEGSLRAIPGCEIRKNHVAPTASNSVGLESKTELKDYCLWRKNDSTGEMTNSNVCLSNLWLKGIYRHCADPIAESREKVGCILRAAITHDRCSL